MTLSGDPHGRVIAESGLSEADILHIAPEEADLLPVVFPKHRLDPS